MGWGSGRIDSASCKLQLDRGFNNGCELSTRNDSERCDGCNHKWQRCKLTQQAIVYVGATKRYVSLVWYVVNAIRTTHTHRHIIVDVDRRENHYR